MCSIQSSRAVGLEFIMGLSRVRVAVEDADGYLHLSIYHLADCYVPAQETINGKTFRYSNMITITKTLIFIRYSLTNVEVE